MGLRRSLVRIQSSRPFFEPASGRVFAPGFGAAGFERSLNAFAAFTRPRESASGRERQGIDGAKRSQSSRPDHSSNRPRAGSLSPDLGAAGFQSSLIEKSDRPADLAPKQSKASGRGPGPMDPAGGRFCRRYPPHSKTDDLVKRAHSRFGAASSTRRRSSSTWSRNPLLPWRRSRRSTEGSRPASKKPTSL